MFHPIILQKLKEKILENKNISKVSTRRGGFYISQEEIREENLSITNNF